MKTNKQNKSGLGSRSAQSSSQNQNTTPDKAPLPPLDYDKRRRNRALPTPEVIQLLRTEAPTFFAKAQVVGCWIWIQFTDKQPREVTTVLAQLGFHWNNKRQAWQHPCGHMTKPSSGDPRDKYRSYRPASHQAA